MTTSSRPRVALVYDRIYPLGNGGGERRFYEIARRISRDYDVAFFYYGNGIQPADFRTIRPSVSADICRSIRVKAAARSIKE